MSKQHFEIKKSKKNGQYYVRLKAANGEILNVSETFKLKGNAIKNIKAVVNAIASMINVTSEDGEITISHEIRIEDLTNETNGLEKKDSPSDDQ